MDKRLMLAASAAILIGACAKKAEDAAATAAPETAAAENTAAEPAAAEVMTEPMVEAAEAAPIGSASIGIGLKDGALYFASAGEGFCIVGGGCQSGIVLNTGDVDLSSFPPGDVTISVTINDDAYNAGYRFPSDAYQAIGVTTWPAGVSTEPPDFVPLFGANAWPTTDFQPPAVSADLRTVTFLDEESAEDAYQYAVAVEGPSGRTILDPEIKNGGKGK